MKTHSGMPAAMGLILIATAMLSGDPAGAASTDVPELLTQEQLASSVANPKSFAALIAPASADDVVAMLIQVMQYLDEQEIGLDAKRAIVVKLFDVVRQTKGAVAPGVISRVRGKVNPRLLPVVRRGGDGGGGDIPPAPLYPGQ